MGWFRCADAACYDTVVYAYVGQLLCFGLRLVLDLENFYRDKGAGAQFGLYEAPPLARTREEEERVEEEVDSVVFLGSGMHQ